MVEEKLKNIPERIGYSFKNPDLLTQAFTRRSYAMEHPGRQHNEVLEFIGDKALDLIVINELVDFYGYINENREFVCGADEGKLTDIKKRLVDEEMLSHRIDVLGFNSYLIMGNGDVNNHVEERSAVKCDLFEAILGAVTIDSGWDFNAIKRVVDKMLDVSYYLNNGTVTEDNNFIGLIQEWYQKKFKEYPDYQFKEVSNIDNKKSFVCMLKIPGIKSVFQDVGDNKQIARSKVAEKAWNYIQNPLKEDANPVTAPKKETKKKTMKEKKQEVPEFSLENGISALSVMSQRKEIEKPVFDYKSAKEGTSLMWTCKVSVNGVRKTFEGKALVKKDAKKIAAMAMANYLSKSQKRKKKEKQ